MKVLTINNVSKSFYTKLGELEVINNLNLELNSGEIIAIVGPSGSGKSTILNLISGLLKPNEGKINVYGNLGYMFQKDQLFEWRTVWKNILIGLEIRRQITEERKKEIEEMLKKYDLADFVNNYPHELSGGMRQRIALIRTLALKPNILLLDEPFSALDYQTRIKVSDDVYNIIRNEKLSAILVTHDISEAIAMADRVIVLSKRPATLKGNHIIEMQEESVTPLLKRKDPNFRMYFDEIWSELNEES
ncbi:MAG: ABC transporter ATP-binding protein [Bacilli bacterium]|nr:ABC transporter ATP-binding protein [Mollicutes bacterium]MDY3898968.1 ABC transporter ATP-binding protein [Bacilli bacterium]